MTIDKATTYGARESEISVVESHHIVSREFIHIIDEKEQDARICLHTCMYVYIHKYI